MTDPTRGCDECGTTDTQHDDDCLYALIENYGDLRHHVGGLAGTRRANFAFDFDHQADAVFDHIKAILRSR